MTLDAEQRARLHGGPWRCPFCGRPTNQVYRCEYENCEQDLAGIKLEPYHD